jgi:hypothetical protein
VNPPRLVRFTSDFFHDLEQQLATTRGPLGQPSRTDFLEYELPSIREIFATRFDELAAAILGRSDYRALIASGSVVRAYSVVGQLIHDGTIEILQLDLELGWPDTSDGDDPDD